MKKNFKNGFVILFTVLISSVILIVIIGVSNISLKETILSSYAKQAHYSFFAADTGIECALYWDLQENAFSLETPLTPNCDGKTVEIISTSYPLFSFYFDVNDNKNCVVVYADKDFNNSQTELKSYGYNLDCSTVMNSPNSRIVERVIRATYNNPGVIE